MNDKIDPSVAAKPAPQGGGAQSGASATQPNRVVRAVAYALVVLLALLGAWAAYQNFGPGTSPPAMTQAPPASQPAAVTPTTPAAPPAETSAVEAPKPGSEPGVAEVPKAGPAPGPAAEGERKLAQDTDRTPAAERSWVSEGGGKPASRPRRPADQTSAALAPSSAEARPDTRAAGAPGAWFVQAGVYNNLANAEAMRDKLAANGFPALMEIRVLTGPYADRAEAQQAQRRMGELEIAPTILVPARKAAPGLESR